MHKPTILFMAPLLLLGACATDREFGEAASHNIAAQAVDMNPQYAGTPIEGGDATRGAEAYRRFLNGNVKTVMRPDNKAGWAQNDLTIPQEKRR